MPGTSTPPQVRLNVLDTTLGGGADGTGVTDSTAAFQAAFAAIAASGVGGSLYVPTGKYKIATGVTYSGTAPLMIVGDGPQSSQLRLANPGDSSTYFSITNTGAWGDEKGQDGAVVINGLSFHNDSYAGAFGNTNIALYLNGVDFGGVYNCGFYKGTGSQRVNQAIVLNECNQVVIDNCNIFAAVNGVAFSGYCQVNAIRDTSIWTPAGTRVPTAAAVLYAGQTLGTHLRGLVFHGGDRGILWTRDSGGKDPHLFVGYDIEPNNHAIAAMEFANGVHVYLSHCIFSGAAISADVPGLLFGPAFEGGALVDSCAFIGQPGHAVQIEGGTGFKFQGCEFGGGGKYKYAAETCDEINIGPGVGEVTIDACHFNVDAVAGLGSSNPPRSAVYVAPGAKQVTVSNSKAAGLGYGTSAVLDQANTHMRKGNIGLGLADTTTAPGSTVTSASAFGSLGAPVTIPANDATTGTVYKVTCFGTGTEATGAAVPLTVAVALGGLNLGTFQPATLPAAGSAFSWRYECDLYVAAAGTSGRVVPSGTFRWGASGTAAATTMHGGTPQTINTTSPNQLGLTAKWASATGAPTITCACTIVERVANFPAS
jgi:Pectate lyase superfamily protein